jgi:molecular chaperone DnaK
MVQEAAMYAEEDKKQREKVEKRNSADSLIYNVEKSMNDLEDKVEETEKAEIEEKIKALREVIDGEDTEAFDNAFQDLQSTAFSLSQKIYEQTQQAETTTEDEVVDAEVVEEV